ncbi:phage major capsid protein [Phaeobacter inhibens]|uniref:phage major capsid protein n=1 Tax=Phaeobacter inhibens TaxID=221822 RepID=UPI000CA20780|nr:phage major capsid protein [Phaeobacter inhibens]AUQ62856.1 phage major capsid protein, HK97 family [Phaeobacter inhibens]AUQ82760.1 phage major capsid protein, HK97 family [Phaeobacter inhibens]AUQ90521.1 phage major capsid protein, HK97 family [Phaeobacter inhibens]MDO6754715.1 phage major capsid protein [Phaeobacter inhibens]
MEHDQGQVIGTWENFAETDRGLEVKGRLFVEGISPAEKARRHLKAGVITGLSIGFRHDGFETRADGWRTFKAVTVTEISLCKRPVHPAARVTEVKAIPQNLKETPKVENEEIETEEKAVTPVNDTPQVPQVDTKAFAEINKRLDMLEVKSKRPQGVHITTGADTERKAFEAFLRRGVERISPDEIKALTVANDTNGGYLAPEETGNELIKLLNEYSPIRRYAKVVNISAESITYPRRVTGTAATWVTETGNRTASGMTFEQVKMTPHELATFTDVSNQLLEDNAYGLEGELLSDFAESFSKTEGLAFVKGTGAGQPMGIMTAADIAEIKTGVAANFPASNPADVIIAMYHKIATTYAQSGVWMMNRSTLAVIRQWKDGNGRYLVLDPISEGAPSTLLGRPVVEMPDMDDIGAGLFPILFGDMSGYRIVDRIGLNMLRDPFSLAVNGQVRFHARKRVGADLTHPDRFIKLKVAA